MAPIASSELIPIAVKTCDGSIEEVVQALPLEAEIPCIPNLTSTGSASIPGTWKLTIDGTDWLGCPLKITPSILSASDSTRFDFNGKNGTDE